MESFGDVFPYLIFGALGVVALVLFTGIISMVTGGRFNARYGNKLMRLRVIAQGIAVLLFLGFVLYLRQQQ